MMRVCYKEEEPKQDFLPFFTIIFLAMLHANTLERIVQLRGKKKKSNPGQREGEEGIS